MCVPVLPKHICLLRRWIINFFLAAIKRYAADKRTLTDVEAVVNVCKPHIGQ